MIQQNEHVILKAYFAKNRYSVMQVGIVKTIIKNKHNNKCYMVDNTSIPLLYSLNLI